jgi:hypothetical protein
MSPASTPHRLLYLCDWLPPDFGAVGQYSLGFARERAAAGEDVTLGGLSSAADSVVEESFPSGGRLRVVRVKTPTYDRSAFVARAWWTARTNLRLLFRLWRELRRSDEVLFTGSPPFLLHFLAPLNLLLRRRLTYRITDFHPECLIAEWREAGRRSRALDSFLRWTVFWRRRVGGFEVLGEDQRARLAEIGIPDERIRLKRDPSPVSIPAGTLPLERPMELAGRYVLLYSGNFGVAHDHTTFVEAYAAHHREDGGGVGLWLNATGAKADLVEREVRARGLPVARSRPVPLEQLARLLVTPDAHLVTLRDAFVGYVLPSKVYGCVASGKPVLFVGSAASDVDLVARQANAAYARVDVGDVAALRRELARLASTATRAETSRC